MSKNEEFNNYEEHINSIININALLILLEKKNIISTSEFVKAKEEALANFKGEFPNLFN